MTRSLQTDPSRHWVKAAMRETVFAPDDTAPILVRSLIAAPFAPDTFNICVSLFRREPREFPPCHAPDPNGSSAGINITMEEAAALRDAISAWLEANGYLSNQDMASELGRLARLPRSSDGCRCGHTRAQHHTIDYGGSTRGVECDWCPCGAPDYSIEDRA